MDAGCDIAWVVSQSFRPDERVCRGLLIRRDDARAVAWAVGQKVRRRQAPDSKRNVDQLWHTWVDDSTLAAKYDSCKEVNLLLRPRHQR